MEIDKIQKEMRQEDIATVLRQYRRKNGFKQNELVEKLKANGFKAPSVAFLSKIETPGTKTKPSDNFLEALLKVYKKTPVDFQQDIEDHIEKVLKISEEQKNQTKSLFGLLKYGIEEPQKLEQTKVWLTTQFEKTDPTQKTYSKAFVEKNLYPKDPDKFQQDYNFKAIQSAFSKMSLDQQNLLRKISQSIIDNDAL